MRSVDSPEAEYYRATPGVAQGNGITLNVLELKVGCQVTNLVACDSSLGGILCQLYFETRRAALLELYHLYQ